VLALRNHPEGHGLHINGAGGIKKKGRNRESLRLTTDETRIKTRIGNVPPERTRGEIDIEAEEVRCKHAEQRESRKKKSTKNPRSTGRHGAVNI